MIRGAAGMGGEGLEEMVSSLANPALQSIYNGRSLRENYSTLNPDDVLYETAIGALLGNIGGVNVMRTVGSTPQSDLFRARSDFLYHAAMDDRAGGFDSAAIKNSYLLPYSDIYSAPTSAMGISSADAMQDWIIEQYIAEIEKAKAADASERAYYRELEHKYLRGNISEEEFEELRKLENIWGQFDAAAKENGTSAKERYRKLEQKFRNSNINEQEWNEMIRLENTLKQPNAPSKRTGTDGASEYARYKELERKFLNGNIAEDEFEELRKLENVWGRSGISSERAVKESELLEQIRLKDDKKAVEIKRIPSILHSRSMASGLRKPPNHTITEAQIAELLEEADSLKIPRDVLQFNIGGRTGFDDAEKMIHVRGDVFPDENSTIARDRMSSRAVLAHEYYGHYLNDPSEYVSGDWRDEYRASRDAALRAPNLTQEERALLMIDAYDRAKEAGVYLEYDEEAVRVIYGY